MVDVRVVKEKNFIGTLHFLNITCNNLAQILSWTVSPVSFPSARLDDSA